MNFCKKTLINNSLVYHYHIQDNDKNEDIFIHNEQLDIILPHLFQKYRIPKELFSFDHILLSAKIQECFELENGFSLLKNIDKIVENLYHYSCLPEDALTLIKDHHIDYLIQLEYPNLTKEDNSNYPSIIALSDIDKISKIIRGCAGTIEIGIFEFLTTNNFSEEYQQEGIAKLLSIIFKDKITINNNYCLITDHYAEIYRFKIRPSILQCDYQTDLERLYLENKLPNSNENKKIKL